jgi:uncharacterized membrane protein (UPF0127 family)
MSAPGSERFNGLPRRELADGRIVIEAATGRSRRLGLARLDSLAPDRALHIPRCPAVHTFTMRFSLDLIWLDRDGAVVRVDHDVAPNRMRICPRAKSVVETLAGQGDAYLQSGLDRADK